MEEAVRSVGLEPAPRVESVDGPGLEMSAPPELSLEELLEFERLGHLCTRDLLSEAEAYVSPITKVAKLEEQQALKHAETMNDDGAAPFLQCFNPHRRHGAAKDLALSERLAGVAAQLLGVDSLRLYQTCIFRKRPGDEATNWHSDLHTTPLDTNAMITAWIPLVNVACADRGGTGLTYAAGSHRDLALAMWYGDRADGDDRYDLQDHGDLRPGDVSWHAGWCLHSAPPNDGDKDRIAFTVTYFADGAHLVDEAGFDRVNDEDSPSYEAWIHDVEPGEPLEHPLLPLVYPPHEPSSQ